MKLKIPEVVTLILVVLALLVPPWKVFLGAPQGIAIYVTEWGFIFHEPDGIGEIDAVLLLIELLFIAGIYFLLRLIQKPPSLKE